MKHYDPEEGFEIDIEKAYEIDYLSYKGILVRYIEDTNTLIFSKGEEEETIIYRNYSITEIKEYIDIDLRTWWEE